MRPGHDGKPQCYISNSCACISHYESDEVVDHWKDL